MTQVNIFHIFAIMQCKIHTEINHTLSGGTCSSVSVNNEAAIGHMCWEGEHCAVFHEVYGRTAGEGFRRFSTSKYAQTGAESPFIILKNSKCLMANCSSS